MRQPFVGFKQIHNDVLTKRPVEAAELVVHVLNDACLVR